MKYILLILPFFFVSGESALALIRPDPNYNGTAHCYTTFDDIGEMESNERRKKNDTCTVAFCREDRSIVLEGCSAITVEDPCQISQGDYSKPYPECCFTITCP